MTAYVVLFSAVLFLTISTIGNREFNVPFGYIIVTFLALVSGLRYGVGVDFFSYYQYAIDLRLGEVTYVEPGYLLIEKLVVLVGAEDQLIFLISSIVTIFFFSRYIFEFSNWPLLSLYLFVSMPIFYLASFNGIRQFIAVSIFLYSIKFLVKGSFSKFILSIIFASTFHIVVIIFAPLYLILNRELSRKQYALISVGYIFSVPFFYILSSFLGLSEKYFSGEFGEATVNLKSLILFPLFLVFYRYRKQLQEKCTGYTALLNMLFISLLLVITPAISDIPDFLITRFTSFFTPAILILIPNAILSIEDSRRRYWILAMVMVMSASYFWYTIIVNGAAYLLVPYDFNLVIF